MENFSWFLSDLLVPLIFYLIFYFLVSPRIVAIFMSASDGARKSFNLPQLELEGWNLNASERSLLIRCAGGALCLSPALFEAFLKPWNWIIISLTWVLSLVTFILVRGRIKQSSN